MMSTESAAEVAAAAPNPDVAAASADAQPSGGPSAEIATPNGSTNPTAAKPKNGKSNQEALEEKWLEKLDAMRPCVIIAGSVPFWLLLFHATLHVLWMAL